MTNLTATNIALTIFSLIVVTLTTHILKQLIWHDPHKPPLVFHLIPLFGSAAGYGQDPYAFFFECRKKYGDVFTFSLLGMKITVYLGSTGNDFILNGKHRDLNAEKVYGPLTIPMFGKGVVYDVEHARLMDQKRLIKDGFTTRNLRAYVPQFVHETESMINENLIFKGEKGVADINSVLAELSLYTAAGALQGQEVRDAFDVTFATHYRHLDDAFIPINFMMPGLPLPVNRRRDKAQVAVSKLYMDIIQKRRESGRPDDAPDLLWELMDGQYKDGTKLTDLEIAHLSIALLMGGQHNTAASGTWILLHLAHRPELIEELYAEQRSVIGNRPLAFEDISRLTLLNHVIKETLRLHSPIHSIMRKVKNPMPIPGTNMVVPVGNILLAAPGVQSRMEEFFPDPLKWDPYRWSKTTASSADNAAGDYEKDVKSEQSGRDLTDVTSKAVYSPYLPFGAGRHRCAGETFAYAQLGAIVATFVRLLQWEQVDMTKPVPKTDYSSMFSRPVMPADIKWRRRQT